MISKSISDLVKEFSAAIFSALLPLYCHGDEAEKRVAVSVLQGKMLVLANLSEDDRDKLIKKNMVCKMFHYMLLLNLWEHFC